MKTTLPLFSTLIMVALATGLCLAQDAPTTAEPQVPDQPPAAARKVDPVGTWSWEQGFGGRSIGRAIELQLDDGKLTGTYLSRFQNTANLPPGAADPVPIEDAKLEGDTITFQVTRSFNGNEFKTSFWGIISGDEIAGITTMNFGGEDRESEWMAKRMAAAAIENVATATSVAKEEDVVGRWKVKFETPQGELEEAFSIEREKDSQALKGTFHSSVFGDNPLKQVTFDGSKLRFVVEMKAGDAGDIKATYEGEPRGSEISGMIAVSFGENNMEIPFVGARVEETPKADEENASPAAPASRATSLSIPEPMRVPDPGEPGDEPYAPRAILPGGIVMPLYPPDSPYLNADRIKEPEQYSLSADVHGRINSIVNIHNPSIEVHFASPSMNTGAVVILAAGGGHRTLNVGTESADFVPYFYNYGVNTVILRNRLRSDGYEPTTDAVRDALQSIRLVRKFADQWKIDPNKIGIMGFSAGAELSAPAAIEFEQFDKDHSDPNDPLAGISSRPDFVGIIYPGPTPFTREPEREVPRNSPPAFITCAGAGDRIHAIWATDYFSAMLRAGVPNVEMHIYGNGYHPGDRGSTGGLTYRKGIPFGTWHERFIDWFDDLGFLGAPGEETKAAVDSREFVSQPPRRPGGPPFGRGGRRSGGNP